MRKLIVILLFLFQPYLANSSTIPYKHLTTTNPNLSVHILTVDPKKYSISFDTAQVENNYKAQTTSTLVKKNNALAGINGSFFDLGEPTIKKNILLLLRTIGINKYHTFANCVLKNKEIWESLSPYKTGYIAWSSDDLKVIIDTLITDWSLIINNNYIFPIKDINKPFADGPILYNHSYGFTTPRIDGIELVCIDNTISAIKAGGNTDVPEHGFILALPHEQKYDCSEISTGMHVLIQQNFISDIDNALLQKMTYIIGSYPLLLKNGQIQEDIYCNTDPFYTKKHPRTAVGIQPSQELTFVIVDGRQQQSVGMTMLELAELMKELGCVDALNLDGGGSSTMVIDNQLINSPSGDSHAPPWARRERPINSAFLIS